MMGPGRYDDYCKYVLEKTDANGVLLVVVNGDKGHGMSLKASLELTLALPDILEQIAKDIRDQLSVGYL